MKHCPECGRTFTNSTLTDCLSDGTPLVEDAAAPPAYPEIAARDYSEEVPFANFEETPSAFTVPARRLPPPYFAAPPVMGGTPPPYFAAQARPPRVSLPVILLLCFLGVIAAIVLRGVRQYQQSSASSALMEAPSTVSKTAGDTMPDLFPGLKLDDTLTETPDSTLRQSLIAAVNTADAAEAKSFSTLSPTPLPKIYSGSALTSELATVQSLKKAGTTQEEQRVAQRFKDFQVNPAHTKAQVDMAETWNTLTRSKASGKVTHRDLAADNSQIISLTHTAHGWVVENIQFYEL